VDHDDIEGLYILNENFHLGKIRNIMLSRAGAQSCVRLRPKPLVSHLVINARSVRRNEVGKLSFAPRKAAKVAAV
jgi:hypothetical protein